MIEAPTNAYQNAIERYRKGVRKSDLGRRQWWEAQDDIRDGFFPAIDETLQSNGKQVCSVKEHPHEATDERKMGIFPIEELGIYDPTETSNSYSDQKGLELRCKSHGKENVNFRIVSGETRIFSVRGEDITEKPIWREIDRYVKIAKFLGLPELPREPNIYFSGSHQYTPHRLAELPRLVEPVLGI